MAVLIEYPDLPGILAAPVTVGDPRRRPANLKAYVDVDLLSLQAMIDLEASLVQLHGTLSAVELLVGGDLDDPAITDALFDLDLSAWPLQPSACFYVRTLVAYELALTLCMREHDITLEMDPAVVPYLDASWIDCWHDAGLVVYIGDERQHEEPRAEAATPVGGWDD